MRRKLLVFLLIPFFMLCAEELVLQTTLNQNLTINNRRIVTLQDNSIWEVFTLQKNSRTWREFWNGLEIDQPDARFLFNMNSWLINSSINVYRQPWSESELSLIYRNNQECLKTCEYLLENSVTHELVFARPITLGSLIECFYNYAHAEYDRGYSIGYSRGHSNGYSKGYREGKADANRNKK